MNRDRLFLEYIRVDKPNTFLKIRTYYDKGGHNYFTGKEERRGYYLSISPVESTRGMEIYAAFSGSKVFLSSANRFSKGKATEIAANFDYTQYQWAVDKVLNDNKLQICQQ